MDVIVERVAALDVHQASVTACVRVPAVDGGREPHLAQFATTFGGCWRCATGWPLTV